jgi:hypothetical protein
MANCIGHLNVYIECSDTALFDLCLVSKLPDGWRTVKKVCHNCAETVKGAATCKVAWHVVDPQGRYISNGPTLLAALRQLKSDHPRVFEGKEVVVVPLPLEEGQEVT